MELCRWFQNLPSDFTLVCVAKRKPRPNSWGLFVRRADAMKLSSWPSFIENCRLWKQRLLYQQSVESDCDQHKCLLRWEITLCMTRMTECSWRSFLLLLLLHEVHGALLWSPAPITCTHVLRVCGCVLSSIFFIHANCKCSQTVSMPQWPTGSCNQ